MDRIEINIDNNLMQNLFGRFQLLWSKKRTRLLFIATIFFIICMSFELIETPEHKVFFLPAAFLVLGMWLSPLISFLIDIIISYKDHTASGSDMLYISENGIGIESGTSKSLLKWSNFGGFREKNKRFVLIRKRYVDTNIALAKRYMSEEIIPSVREVLKLHLEEFK